jgi:hypothetical protein
MAKKDLLLGADLRVGITLTAQHVWDTFQIKFLLDDCVRSYSVLQVPHTGAQKDRFTAAMNDYTQRLVLIHGHQPEARTGQ